MPHRVRDTAACSGFSLSDCTSWRAALGSAGRRASAPPKSAQNMSLFDYPRINFKGTIQLNPGTANNDDYAQQPGALLPASHGPRQVLGLIDSKTVQPRTYGMSDADFIAWVQKAHTFDI